MKVEIERVMKAGPEKLYKMWTDPELISKWMGVKVKIVPKLGGEIVIDFAEECGVTTGKYIELSPFTKVAFTWNSYGSDNVPTGETLVTITFEPNDPEGKSTLMKLLHTGFKTESARAAHDAGWLDYYQSWEKKLV